MNGRINGPLPELDVDNLLIADTIPHTGGTAISGSVSSSSNKEVSVSIDKIEHYRLIGVGGWEFSGASGSSYLCVYESKVTIGGEGEQDTVTLGLKNTQSSSSSYNLVLKLIYAREE